jgi:hypothetical protein
MIRDLPGWQLLQEIKESNAATLIGISGIKSSGPGSNQACSAHKSQNDQGNYCSNRDTDPQILVGLRCKSSDPEIGQEEIVRQYGDWQDIDKLPTKKTGFGQAR